MICQPEQSSVCIGELDLLGLEGVVFCTRYMVLKNEMKGPAKLLETNPVSIHEAEITALVRIDGIELHGSGLCEGGRLVAHKPPGEGMYLINV